MTTRRGFIGAMLAGAMAPAIVKASSLMPIYVPKVILPSYMTLHGNGIHDDTAAMAALLTGGTVLDATGKQILSRQGTIYIPPGNFLLSNTVMVPASIRAIFTNSTFKAAASFPKDAALLYFGEKSDAAVIGCSFVAHAPQLPSKRKYK